MERDLVVETALETPNVLNKKQQSEENKQDKKLPNLDPLRFFLVFLVILSHVSGLSKTVGVPYYDGHPIFVKGGGQAVHIFFVLSGFLIIKLLYLEKEKTGTVNIGHFYLRRILRIYPVYYAVLTFGLIFYCFILPRIGEVDEVTHHIKEAIILCVGFMPNVLSAIYKVGAILFVLWSIGVEEQFYLMIAPVVKYLKVSRLTFLLAAFTVIYFVLFNTPIFDPVRKFKIYYYFFSMGGLVSVLDYQGKIEFLKFKQPFRVILYVVFFASFLFDSPANHALLLIREVFFVILYALVILNLATETQFVIRNKAINYLGKISYGIYMYHVIAIYMVLFPFMKFKGLAHLNSGVTIVLINILVILLSVFIAHLSYIIMEKRILTLKAKIRHT